MTPARYRGLCPVCHRGYALSQYPKYRIRIHRAETIDGDRGRTCPGSTADPAHGPLRRRDATART